MDKTAETQVHKELTRQVEHDILIMILFCEICMKERKTLDESKWAQSLISEDVPWQNKL